MQNVHLANQCCNCTSWDLEAALDDEILVHMHGPDGFDMKGVALIEPLAKNHILSPNGNYCALRKTIKEATKKQPSGGEVFYMMAYVFMARHTPFLTDFKLHYC
jgi:hypothetical protein